MRIRIIFKNGKEYIFNNVNHFGIRGKHENMLRIDMDDDKAAFINFSEVLACIEEDENDEP